MEKVKELAVIPADVGWSDLGSWTTVWELGKRDEHGNVAPDSAVLVDAQNNLIENLRTVPAGKRVIALVGVPDLCEIVAALKGRGDPV